MYSYSRFLIVFLFCDPKNKSIQIPAESNVSQKVSPAKKTLGLNDIGMTFPDH